MRFKFYLFMKVACITVALLSVLSVKAQNKIYFLYRAGTHQADDDLIDSLTAWGYTVTSVDALPADYTGYLGLFINETISSGTANDFGATGATAQNYPVPCVNLEGWSILSNRMGGWVTDESSTDPKTDWHQGEAGVAGEDGQVIIIKDNTHYITNEYALDQEVAWAETSEQTVLDETSPVSFKEVGVTYSAKLAKAKSYDEEDFWTMVTVDSAEAGFPNRMFLWGMVSAGIEGPNGDLSVGTNDYYNILKRASLWTFRNNEVPEISSIESLTSINTINVYPNPAADKAMVRFFATENMDVKVSLYSLTGQELEVLSNKTALIGYNFVDVDAAKYPSGVYFVKLETSDGITSRKLVLE